jgi:Arm DNA-binding domain
MPRIKLTKSAIDVLPTSKSDIVYWDAGCPGFGVKVTPKGRKVFIVLYRVGGAGSRLRKYTIGPYGRVTLHQARVAAQKVFAAKLEGRDPAAEKREAKRRVVADRVDGARPGHPRRSKDWWSVRMHCRALGADRPAPPGGRRFAAGGVRFGATDLDRPKSTDEECESALRPEKLPGAQ